MIQTMKLQFFDLLGTVESDYLDIDTDMINDFVGHGLRDMVSLVRQYNPAKLHHFGVVESITAQSYDASAIDMDMIISITRDLVINSTTYNKLVRQVPYALRGGLTDVGSKQYAIKADPGGYFDESDLLTILPIPTAAEKGYLEYVNFASPDVGTNDSIADITNCRFPDSLTRAVLLYAVVQAKIRELGYVRRLGQIEIDDMFGVTVIDSASFTDETQIVITHSLGYAPILTLLDENGKEIGTEVIHNVPTYTTITINFLFAQSGSWSIANANVAGGLLATFENALPTWSAVTSPTLPTAIVPGNLTAAAKALPSFASIAFPGITAPTSPNLPSAITPGNVAAASKNLQNYSAIDFTSITPPTVLSGTAGAKPTITSLTKTFADISTDRIYHALNYAADLIYKDQPDSDTLTDDVKTFLAAHDTEEAQVAVSAVSAAVQAGRAEIEAEVAQLKTIAEEIKHVLGKLNGEVASYKAEIDGDISEFRANIERYTSLVGKTVKAWVEENKLQIDLFSADLKERIDQFKAEIDADLNANKIESDALISKYRGDIENYVTKLNRVINTYTAENKLKLDIFLGELKERVEQYRAEIEAEINSYKAESDSLLGKYRTDVEQEVQRNTIGIQKAASYLQEVDRKLNVVNMYFARSSGFLAEYKELNGEYLRRVLSFCGVVPQTERR